MRKLLSIIVIGMVSLSIAGTVSAAIQTIESSVATKLGFGKVGITTGTGVVTVNGLTIIEHLDSVRLAPTDPADAAPAPVTDPETTGTIASNIVDGAFGRGGTFAPISGGGALSQNTLALAGVARVCLVVAGCGASLNLILTENNGATGVGVGGIITIGYPGAIRISLINAPWQLGESTLLQSTANGQVITRKYQGFVHGPNSVTSSTAKASGQIQLVTPVQILTQGIGGNSKKIALFTSFQLHFVPEPGLMLLLGSGVAGLALLGRSRMRK